MNPTEEFSCDLVAWAINSKPDKKLAAKVIKEFVLWKWSTRHGKYKKCQYWSESALEQYRGGDEVSLRHEHIIPRSFLADWLIKKYSKESATREKIFDDLARFCLGCVLTQNEDDSIRKDLTSKMPKDWNQEDPWARYREAFQNREVTIWKVIWDGNNFKKTEKILSV